VEPGEESYQDSYDPNTGMPIAAGADTKVETVIDDPSQRVQEDVAAAQAPQGHQEEAGPKDPRHDQEDRQSKLRRLLGRVLKLHQAGRHRGYIVHYETSSI